MFKGGLNIKSSTLVDVISDDEETEKDEEQAIEMKETDIRMSAFKSVRGRTNLPTYGYFLFNYGLKKNDEELHKNYYYQYYDGNDGIKHQLKV